MPKIFIFALIASALISFTLSDCSDKAILDSSHKLLYSNYAYQDYKLAYNKAASCATLSSGDTDKVCCYLKIKFENEVNEEKYTHTGCYAVPLAYLTDSDNGPEIDDLIDNIEGWFDANNTNPKLVSKTIDLDCGSKYIHLAGLALLILLL